MIFSKTSIQSSKEPIEIEEHKPVEFPCILYEEQQIQGSSSHSSHPRLAYTYWKRQPFILPRIVSAKLVWLFIYLTQISR